MIRLEGIIGLERLGNEAFVAVVEFVIVADFVVVADFVAVVGLVAIVEGNRLICGAGYLF